MSTTELNSQTTIEVTPRTYELQGAPIRDTMMLDSLRLPEEDPAQKQREADKLYNSLRLYELTSHIKADAAASMRYPVSVIPQKEMRSMIREEMTLTKAADKLSRHDFGDISIYLNRLSELTFLEAYDLKQRVDAEILRLKHCRESITCFRSLHGENINTKIMITNALNSSGYGDMSIEDFEAKYDELMATLEAISDALIKLIDTRKDVMSHTRYISTEMVILFEKKLSELDKSDPNYNYTRKVIETKIDAFRNRTNYDWMANRLTSFVKTHKKKFRQMVKRDFIPALNAHRMPEPVANLVKIFGEDTIVDLWNILLRSGIFIDEMYAWFIILSKAIESDKNGSSVWAKLFILNASDYCNGVYDLETPKEYSAHLFDLNEILVVDSEEFDQLVSFPSKTADLSKYTFGLNVPDYILNHINEIRAGWHQKNTGSVNGNWEDMIVTMRYNQPDPEPDSQESTESTTEASSEETA